MLVVRRSPQFAPGRATRVEQPFQLRTRDHVGVATVAVLLEFVGVERLEAGGNDDRADDLLGLVAEGRSEFREFPFNARQDGAQTHVYLGPRTHLGLDLAGEFCAVVEAVVVEERKRT